MIYTYPQCKWYVCESDSSEYPDTEQGQDVIEADFAYLTLEIKAA